MNTINYKGIDYPTKTFSIVMDGEGREITIATGELSDAMGDLKEYPNTIEENIDGNIYYYVTKEDILLDNETIARNHLDESFELAKEEGAITKWQVQQWMGDDLGNRDYVIGLISEIVNGTYNVEQLKSDISNYE